MAAGGARIKACREKFTAALQAIVTLASLQVTSHPLSLRVSERSISQTSFIKLDEAIKITSRRVNALEYVVSAPMSQTSHYVNALACVSLDASNPESSEHHSVCQVIPRIEDQIDFVLGELDELEREEFFRFTIALACCGV